jgi:serine/threonine protein phosphatase 1
MKRTFCIGDIHGGFRALIQVLEKSNFDKDNDTLISLGDLCDGWSETPEVIEELLTIKNLITLKGNHDLWLTKFLLDEENFTYESEYHLWVRQGGSQSIKSYIRRPELKSKHLRFLLSNKYYYIDEDNNLFVHAGIDFNKPIDKQYHPAYQYDQYCWNRDMWYNAYGGKNSKNEYNNIYIGHTPTISFPQSDASHLKPMKRFNITNMDTGAGYTGMLSMMDINSKELFQSDKLTELYPDERGRN